jgi:hypothetical protein
MSNPIKEMFREAAAEIGIPFVEISRDSNEKERDDKKRLCLSCGAVIRKDICPHCDGDSIEEL